MYRRLMDAQGSLKPYCARDTSRLLTGSSVVIFVCFVSKRCLCYQGRLARIRCNWMDTCTLGTRSIKINSREMSEGLSASKCAGFLLFYFCV